MKKALALILLIPFFTTAQQKTVKNVILLIGDGMGLAQMSTAYYYGGDDEPNFSRFPIVGLINTSSAKQRVTDSAAGATAFATGRRSYNGAISVDTNRTNIPTITEVIRGRGIKSGLVVTSSITHATPACFYAHAESRREEEKIAQFLPGSGIHYFAGGGLKYFTQRSDNHDLIGAMLQRGFILDTTDLIPDGMIDPDKRYGYLLSPGGLPSKLEGRGDFLTEATKGALDYLSLNERGFFLMVEGSQIDWEGHGTNAIGIIEEVKDFDKAVGVALDFAEKNGETIVIVTADHETGGFALTPSVEDGESNYENISPSFYEGATKEESADHTATLIPVLAYGPGASVFSGIYKNSDIYHKIMELTDWKAPIKMQAKTTLTGDDIPRKVVK
ncbi:MAG: alkaline phosphatase [Crocinitomicaceae bacterium]|nr:alkaline phosphatase [Crocinitomicaceae bacterium]